MDAGEVFVPALGVALEQVTIVRWLKEPGESVAEEEPIAEIETDKTTVEIVAPRAGILGRHRFEVGASVPVGTVVAKVLQPGEADDDEPASADGDGSAPPDIPERPAAEVRSSAQGPPRARHRLSPRARRAERAAEAKADRAPEANADRLAEANADRLAEANADRAADTAPAPDTTAVPDIDISGYPVDQLEAWLEEMIFIRHFEESLERQALAGAIPGGVHAAIGQEAVAVGMLNALAPADLVASGHRPHHHALVKGLGANEIMAELFGKAPGCAGGRGGSMHLVGMDKGYLGGNGIVGSSLGIAMGAALAAKLRGSGQVAVGFFGDGGANTGRVWETLNLAATWRLPLIAVCENNLYAVTTSLHDVFAGESVAQRAAGFGLPSVQVDGQDVVAVHRTAVEAVARARAGDGPTFVEALTYRYSGHMSGEAPGYRTDEELAEWRDGRDPIARLATALRAVDAIAEGAMAEYADKAQETARAARAFAQEAAWPDPSREHARLSSNDRSGAVT